MKVKEKLKQFEAEKVTNTVQNTIQASIEDISKVINVADWILEYGNCEPTDDTEMQNGKLYFEEGGYFIGEMKE